MFQLFRDPAVQARFERDGFVRLPILEPEDISRLRAHWDGISDGLGVSNTSYGVFVSHFHEGANERERTRDLIEKVLFPRLDAYLQEYKAHAAGFLVKVSSPTSWTFPHQDWTFVDDDLLDEYFAATIWVPLGDCRSADGALGFVAGSHRFARGAIPSPSPAAPTTTRGLRIEGLPGFETVELRAGEAVAFDTRIVHGGTPNLGPRLRVAVALGLTPTPARLHHYFLEPGTTDHLLKLAVSRDFFLRYSNDDLQKLWTESRIPEGATVVGRRPFRPTPITVEDLAQLASRRAAG